MCFAARSKHAFGPGACDGVSDQSVPPVRLQRGTERHPEPARAPGADGERAVQLPDGRGASWAQPGEAEPPSLTHHFACLSLRRTLLRWTKSWRTWTPTETARLTLKSLCPWLWDCPSPVSSAIRRTWGRLEKCKESLFVQQTGWMLKFYHFMSVYFCSLH